MIKVYKTDNGLIHKLQKPEEGSWIMLEKPSSDELDRISELYHIDPIDLRASLDDEESSRIQLEDEYTVVLIDIPAKENRNDTDVFTTIPLGIIFNEEVVITVCMEETSILNAFRENRIKSFSTKKKLRFVYQILFSTASLYQRTLRIIDRDRMKIEEGFALNMQDSDLIGLHELESTLVYFATSLRANEVVLNRLSLYKRFEQFPEDTELLDDVIIETKQAIEMTTIYKDILNGTRDLLSTILDNRLNNVMKYLTSITLVMAIPTIISGFFGMNVPMPLSSLKYAFYIIALITIIICLISLYLLKRKKML